MKIHGMWKYTVCESIHYVKKHVVCENTVCENTEYVKIYSM
jgi:hypothetical protein